MLESGHYFLNGFVGSLNSTLVFSSVLSFG